MGDDKKPDGPKNPLFKKEHQYQLDALIGFLKLCGYKETEKENVFVYIEDRKTLTQLAGAVHRQVVNAEELVADKDKLGRFIRRWVKKKPALRAEVEKIWAKGNSPVPPKE